jgi:hypothetical protein
MQPQHLYSRPPAISVAWNIVPDAAADANGVAWTIRDIALIGLGWALLIGVILYPVAQLVGLLTCAIALAASRAHRAEG